MIDHSDTVGWPAKATRVYRIRGSRYRRETTWRNRKNQPLWYRALAHRGSLR